MVDAVPQIIRVPRPPFSKPESGLGINWRHPFAKGLVHSYPFNEGQGAMVKNYAQPTGQYDLKFRVPNTADSPSWGTFDKVNGLHLSPLQTNPLDQKYGNTGTTNPNSTGANLLPGINYSRGFTVHLWLRPTAATIFGINLFNLGPVNEVTRVTAFFWLQRFAASGQDWWRRNIVIYSDGSTNTTLSNSDEVWLSPSLGGAVVGIDSLPYEHVISIPANGASGSVRWFSSDGYDFGFAGAGTITPPDNNQYWPVFNVGGQEPMEGNVWGVNVYNYAMGRDAAFALMRNPLQMYKVKSVSGYGANVLTGADPPTTDGDVTPGTSGPTSGPDPDRFTGSNPPPYTETPFIYYAHQYEFLKDPLDVTRHDSYELDFGWTRWKFIRRLWFSGISTSTITLQIYVDEILKHTTTFTMIPATGTGWAKTLIKVPAGLKGQLFRFVLTANSAFKIFLDQSDIEWHMLSGDRGYQRAQMLISHLHER